MIFNDLSIKERLELYQKVHVTSGLSKIIIEKDWWVTSVLRALFSVPYSGNLSFKGGTSLSKCWGLVERFSEDVDVAVNREFLGFVGTLSKTQISDRLRRSACSFVREKLQFDLVKQLENNGLSENDFSVKVNITPITTTDPEIIENVIESKNTFRNRDCSNYSHRGKIYRKLANKKYENILPKTQSRNCN